jgi:hypothetical protein
MVLMLRKCSKWVLGKKSAFGDRPAVKKSGNAVAWDRMSFATKPIVTESDIAVQKQQVSCMKYSSANSHFIASVFAFMA